MHDSGIIHGPEPPPASSRSLLDYFRPSRRTQASRPSQGVQTTATSSASHGVQTTATSSASQGAQTAPMVTNLLNPPRAMFNLYDDDDLESVHSEEDGWLGADVTDA